MTTSPLPVYDSDQKRLPLAELRHFWQYRSLVWLLASRDLTVRYKRSLLGVWWTLLNPLLTIAVLWVVFSQLFSRVGSGVPFVVYLTSGILVAGFFSQAVIAAGAGVINNRGILARVYVPPEVFSLAAAVAAAANFAVSLVPLVIIQIIQGVGVPWDFLFVPVSMFFMLMMVTGIGLVVASVAVMFYDVFELVRVVSTLVTYLAATFYPIAFIPEQWQLVIKLNPLYHHVVLFRSYAYNDWFSWTSFAVSAASGVVALAIGVWVFSRNWRNVVVSL
jgi:ABC-type polysaccharide/polyol phosphate export permease